MANNSKDILNQIQSVIPQEHPAESVGSGFYLFISIDLVSFTQIKSEKEYPAWKNILSRFYDYIRNGIINSDYGHCRVWKLRGDEVILKWRITDIKSIPGLLFMDS